MPAAQAGITAGDIITKFDGVAVSGPGDLQQLVERVNVGDKKDVEILRDGKPMTLSVAPKPMPDDVMFASRQRRSPATKPRNRAKPSKPVKSVCTCPN